jgi:hypothetical protein
MSLPQSNLCESRRGFDPGSSFFVFVCTSVLPTSDTRPGNQRDPGSKPGVTKIVS